MKNRRHHVRETGYVYVLSNPAMPGILKIGMTHRTPQERLKELNSSTGVLPFTLEAFVTSTDVRMTEREIHRRLAGRRVSDRREFFNVGLPEALTVVRTVARLQGHRLSRKGGSSAAARASGAVMMTLALAAGAAWIDVRLVLGWMALAAWAATTGIPREARDFLRIADDMPVWMSSAISGLLVLIALAPLLGPQLAGAAAELMAG